MGTVVVTGVAGALGRRVAALLAARPGVDRIIGIDVAVISGLPPLVELHTLDLAGTDDLSGLFAGADGVIHLAWSTPERPRPSAAERMEIAQVNQRALRRVLEAAASAHPRNLVHLSSGTVYGAWADNRIPLTEDAPLRPNPEFAFAVGKGEAERVVSEWADDHPEITVAVIRPAVTVGFPERPLYQALGGTRSPKAGDGGRPVQFLHIDDLASAVVLVYAQRERGVFNAAPDNGIGEDVARALAGGLAKLTLPGRLAQTVSAWTWQLWRTGTPKEARAYSTHPWVLAADRLREKGWVPLYSSEEALVATDVRPHWDDLPPGTRQNYTLLLTVGAVAAAGGALTAAAAALRRRRQGS